MINHLMFAKPFEIANHNYDLIIDYTCVPTNRPLINASTRFKPALLHMTRIALALDE
jgi:hypothetical protein